MSMILYINEGRCTYHNWVRNTRLNTVDNRVKHTEKCTDIEGMIEKRFYLKYIILTRIIFLILVHFKKFIPIM